MLGRVQHMSAVVGRTRRPCKTSDVVRERSDEEGPVDLFNNNNENIMIIRECILHRNG